MRSQFVTSLLALFLGVFGVHRFYLGQYLKGAIYILFPAVLAAVLALIKPDISDLYLGMKNEFQFLPLLNNLFFVPLPFYALVMVVALFDAIWFVRMPRSKFNSRYNTENDSWGKTLLLSLIAIVISGALLWIIYGRFFAPTPIDVEGTAAVDSLSSSALYEKFQSNPEEAEQLYLKEVVEVTGIVVDFGMDLGETAKSIELEGFDEFNTVRCTFLPSQSAEIGTIQKGQEITVKGYCTGMLTGLLTLTNCLLLEKGKVKPIQQDTITPIQDTLDVNSSDFL